MTEKEKSKFFIKWIRPFYANPLGIYYFFIYLWKFITDKKIRDKYYKNKKAWNNIKTFNELCAFIKNNNRYASDGFDHNNTKLEFFIKYDCEDLAYYVHQKLKKMKIKSRYIYVLWEDNKGHIDLIVNGKVFNYGKMSSIEILNKSKYWFEMR